MDKPFGQVQSMQIREVTNSFVRSELDPSKDRRWNMMEPYFGHGWFGYGFILFHRSLPKLLSFPLSLQHPEHLACGEGKALNI